MEKKAKIIATLGPAIYSENKLKKLVDLGVDAFRINFSHNTNGINKIISRIRKVEKKDGKKLSLIADLQGVKLRIGKVKSESQKISFNQKFVFDNEKTHGDSQRVSFPYPKMGKENLINSLDSLCSTVDHCITISRSRLHDRERIVQAGLIHFP